MDEEFEAQRDKTGLLTDDRGKKGTKIDQLLQAASPMFYVQNENRNKNSLRKYVRQGAPEYLAYFPGADQSQI